MRRAISALLALLCGAAHSITPGPKLPPVQVLSTPKGTQYGLIGAIGADATRSSSTLSRRPRPLFVVFSSDINTTFGFVNSTGVAYYSASCPWLTMPPLPDEPSWLCVTIDLPSHGAQVLPGEPVGIAGWRWRHDKQMNFTAANNARMLDVVDTLVAEGLADPNRIVASGISRGGYMAAHYALADDRVRALGLLSPVTNLSLLSEFGGEPATGQPALRILDLQASADRLALKDVWTIIGDQDTR